MQMTNNDLPQKMKEKEVYVHYTLLLRVFFMETKMSNPFWTFNSINKVPIVLTTYIVVFKNKLYIKSFSYGLFLNTTTLFIEFKVQNGWLILVSLKHARHNCDDYIPDLKKQKKGIGK